ncbi:MAG: T9SS type A sorting domain-containing protein, partial [Bacteroidota bacterium]|nr:T9SS type A sorting domain-containing protein [Bacteroidota bacterium]
CHHDSTAYAVALGIGGTPFLNGDYLYNWYNSLVGPNNPIISNNDTAFNLPPGTYFVRITDANGCDTNASVQIISPQNPIFTSNQIVPVVCKGDSSGYIVGDAGGGFPPYTYIWSTSLGGVIQQHSGLSNTDTLHHVPAGVYLLDIIDHRGCLAPQSSITVNEPLHPLRIDTVILVDSIDCFGDSTGRAIVYHSGGDPSGLAPAFAYLWDNGEIDSLAQHLTSGYRSVTVTDGRGCEVIDSVFVPESSEIVSTLVIDSTINCYGSSNGIVSVSTFGGHPTYVYSWSNNQPLDTGVVDTAFNLSYGSYALTTEDTWGCSVVDSIFLTEPDLLTMEASELEWISCKDSADGLAFATAQGGTMPYTFSWDGNQVGDTVNTLSPGVHLVTVTDAKGCTASDTVTIHEPPYLVVSISDIVPIYCNGVSTGSLTASASGGTPGYTYLWDDNQVLPQITATATHLEADIYTVTATDSRGCTASATEDISVVIPTMDLDTSFTNVSCHGSSNGSASVTTFGGHAPYIYTWVGPNNAFVSSLASINNLSAGTYSVTVVDTNNCTRNSSVDIIEPLPITYNISTSSDETCLGACNGQIFIDSITGGTLPYIGVITSNTTGTVYSLPMTTDSVIPNVCAGDYTVTLSDVNLCSSSLIPAGNNQAIVNSITATLITPSIAITENVGCYGDSTGEIVLSSPSPINTNYIYTLYNTNGYMEGDLTNPVSGLSVGDYYAIAQFQNFGGIGSPSYHVGPIDSSTTDGDYSNWNGYLELECTSPTNLISTLVYASGTNIITFELRDNTTTVLDDTTLTVFPGPQRIFLDFDIPAATGLELGVSTGNTGLFRNRQPQGSVMAYPYVGSTVSIVGSGAGDRYYYFFYDLEMQELASSVIAGCTSYSDTLTITQPFSPLSVSGSVSPADCYGDNSGSISITVQGGTPNNFGTYNYSWSNGSNTATINNLVANDYIVTITDENSCVLTETFTVTEADEINISIARGSNNSNTPAYYELSIVGSTATGGFSPYNYIWRQEYPAGVYTTVGGGLTYTVYSPGNYSVFVTDAHNCTMQSNAFNYVSTALFDNSEAIKLEIYPNPFNKITTVDFGQIVSSLELRVFNVVGEIIEIHSVSNTDKLKIERGDKVDGVYFVEIEIEDKKIFKKIILE